MKKLSASSAAIKFEKKIDDLLDYYRRTSSALSSSPTSKQDNSTLCEQVFLLSSVAFEVALSDIYLAHLNKDSSIFFSQKENEIKQKISNSFGPWYSDNISMQKPKHLNAKSLLDAVDPRGYNITFKDSTEMINNAKKSLHSTHSQRYARITSNQKKFINCVRSVRNRIAHSSNSSLESMTNSLHELSPQGPYAMLYRPKSRKVQNVGTYLRNLGSGKTRLEIFMVKMKEITNILGR